MGINLTLGLHYARTRNIGDLVCSPLDYFRFPNLCHKWHIYDAWPMLKGVRVVLGGGGIGGDYHTDVLIRRVLSRHPGPCALWGAGTNRGLTLERFAESVSKLSIVGIRDWEPECKVQWVPCASCMDTAFDERYDVSNEVVVYEHALCPVEADGIPRMDNYIRGKTKLKDRFRECIRFLASGETVVTSSYHGAYWATLLGKKVVCVPPGNEHGIRFKYLRHKPVLTQRGMDWREAHKKAARYEGALPECRRANEQFYGRVMEAFA